MKFSLADRSLEYTGAIQRGLNQPQSLDKLLVERLEGITIKAQTTSMIYRQCNLSSRKVDKQDFPTFLLNLIDIPGHVDFDYEVSRVLAACEGVILVEDTIQGIQSQTVADFYLDPEYILAIIPVINKSDLPTGDPNHEKELLLQGLGLHKFIAFIVGETRFATGGVDGCLKLFEWLSICIVLDESRAHKPFKDMDSSLDSEFLDSTSIENSWRIWYTLDGALITTLARHSDEKIEVCQLSRGGTKPFLFGSVQRENKPLTPFLEEIQAIKLVSERRRDRSLLIKGYIVGRLSDIYKVSCMNGYSNSTENGHYDWIVRKILRSVHNKDCRSDTSIRSLVLFLIDVSGKDKVTKWVGIFSGFDNIEVTALDKILKQKQRVQRDTTLTEEGNFQILYQIKDSNVWKLWTGLLDPNTSSLQASSSRKDMLKILGDKHRLIEFISALSLKCSYLLVDKDHVKALLLKIGVQKSFRINELILPSLILVRFWPLMIAGIEEDLVYVLKGENEIIEGVLTVLHILVEAVGINRGQLEITYRSLNLILGLFRGLRPPPEPPPSSYHIRISLVVKTF